MLRFATLGSGSSGNATVVQGGDTCVLVDNGFTIKETVRRLAQAGLQPEDISAIVVTHEHGDHISGVGPFSRRYNTPVWMTHGTFGATRDKKIADLNLFHAHEPMQIGDLSLEPFPTPHDAAESCQFVFSCGAFRFATLTDLGCTTPYLQSLLTDLDALLLECNYDADMLRNGPYGESLQARIRGAWGHLDNVQAARFLEQIDTPRLRRVLLGHLSEKNNCPDVVMETIGHYAPKAVERARIMSQSEVSDWYELA
ncbi:MBL fold metallo-hydrolase [Granulosicoccaceae sp. 1_MG-2023]|nr:MBL fold metallo-hydrolase [Granulosicoccaceae sp. 1_MG-2023]